MSTTSAPTTRTTRIPPAGTLKTPEDWAGTVVDSTTPRLHPLLVPGACVLVFGLLGALFMRRSGWSAASIGAGLLRGAATGGVLGGALVGVDHLTGGLVRRTLKPLHEVGARQWLFAARNAHRPWVMLEATRLVSQSNARRRELFGPETRYDGPSDAFNHAYASALLSIRAQRDHGMSAEDAASLARDAGRAHESDVSTDPNDARRMMDLHNNDAGLRIAATAHAGDRWMTDLDVERAVLDAIRHGELLVADDARSGLRITKPHDLPPEPMR